MSMRKGWMAQSRLETLLVISISIGGRANAVEGFLRGDTDLSGRLTVTDAIRVLRHLFAGDASAVPCEDAADLDDNGKLDLSDVVGLLQFVFRGGASPPTPFPTCGPDGTVDELGCASPRECDPTFRYWDLDFEGGCIVWVIDQSPTVVAFGGLERAKQETVETIGKLTADTELAVLFFAGSLRRFPSSGIPLRATPELKESAIAYVNGAGGGSGTCGRPALLSALDIALRSSATNKVILYVSDGGGTCAGNDEATYLIESVEAVTEANAGRVQIHTLEIGTSSAVGKAYMRSLAEINGGSYFVVQ